MSQAAVPNDFWMNWTTALHLVGRYGFLPDQEVPFGRLQPYVGIGPAVIVLYEEVDSAKNFGIDVMAGVRYMFTKHIGAFVEYKYNHQWDVEVEQHPFYLPNGAEGRGMAHLDFDCHKVVMGWPTTGRETTFSSRRSGGPRAAFSVTIALSHQPSAFSQEKKPFLNLIP